MESSKQNQIVLPLSLQKRAVNIAHQGHLGIAKSKALLRTKVFWPTMDQDVREKIATCLACQAVTDNSKPEPLKMSPMPKAPWSEISIDFHGPLPSGDKLFVILDEYSRFPIIHTMKSTNAQAVINKLENTFSVFGYPDQCKSDNGPPFNYIDLRNYMHSKSIKHRRITPEHPQSNAKCERFMRVLRKNIENGSYRRKTVEKGTGQSSFQLPQYTTYGNRIQPSLIILQSTTQNRPPPYHQTTELYFSSKSTRE